MATGSYIAVTPGNGDKIATGPAYTEGGQSVKDQKIIAGEPYRAVYRAVSSASISIATAASHVFQIMAGSTYNVYVRRIRVFQTAAATTAALAPAAIYRLSSAGTGGTSVNVSPVDTADAAAGATAMTLPSAKGTEGVALGGSSGYLIQTVGATLLPGQALIWEFEWGDSWTKNLRIAAGTSNGIALKNINAQAGATVMVEAEIVESPV